jgi:hypothetical protein
MKKINKITAGVTLALGLIATAAALTTAPHQWVMAAMCYIISAAHGLENYFEDLKENLKK